MPEDNSGPIIPPEAVGDEKKLVAAIRRLYRRRMAQVANWMMRISPSTLSASSVDTTGDDMALEGHWTNTRRVVIKQDRVSNIVPQVLLAVMFACGVGAYMLLIVCGDGKELLPHNPCSIAGTVSLLARSAMCRCHDDEEEEDIAV
ncbi:hypothetical protein B0H63DRAFT_529076 [Podospora didyma]|uniref:Transmembrane protein n=1 Tax=Podospora didyma TaxID=330526 RepID=A0AAE0N3F7_9PEZI|nr:hypothetical protein B0H63DRAFT_529076 [Podospora didyma]